MCISSSEVFTFSFLCTLIQINWLIIGSEFQIQELSILAPPTKAPNHPGKKSRKKITPPRHQCLILALFNTTLLVFLALPMMDGLAKGGPSSSVDTDNTTPPPHCSHTPSPSIVQPDKVSSPPPTLTPPFP
ncbi:hypothetical protein HNY73_009117 [Argiope bruennichi]|uniref:Uncharacterized protein n=1 Tax=Argiope bruennichi TaxID=94029 RepID=A0A8T0F8J8_ARGBR|nr:hypothetical protein HNY73_009117 [Argiope bruennichi]